MQQWTRIVISAISIIALVILGTQAVQPLLFDRLSNPQNPPSIKITSLDQPLEVDDDNYVTSTAKLDDSFFIIDYIRTSNLQISINETLPIQVSRLSKYNLNFEPSWTVELLPTNPRANEVSSNTVMDFILLATNEYLVVSNQHFFLVDHVSNQTNHDFQKEIQLISTLNGQLIQSLSFNFSFPVQTEGVERQTEITLFGGLTKGNTLYIPYLLKQLISIPREPPIPLEFDEIGVIEINLEKYSVSLNILTNRMTSLNQIDDLEFEYHNLQIIEDQQNNNIIKLLVYQEFKTDEMGEDEEINRFQLSTYEFSDNADFILREQFPFDLKDCFQFTCNSYFLNIGEVVFAKYDFENSTLAEDQIQYELFKEKTSQRKWTFSTSNSLRLPNPLIMVNELLIVAGTVDFSPEHELIDLSFITMLDTSGQQSNQFRLELANNLSENVVLRSTSISNTISFSLTRNILIETSFLIISNADVDNGPTQIKIKVHYYNLALLINQNNSELNKFLSYTIPAIVLLMSILILYFKQFHLKHHPRKVGNEIYPKFKSEKY